MLLLIVPKLKSQIQIRKCKTTHTVIGDLSGKLKTLVQFQHPNMMTFLRLNMQCMGSVHHITISLHIRSMWETICGKTFQKVARQGKIFTKIGKNTLFWDLVQNTPLPEMKSWPDVGTWVLTTTEHPPPQFKFRQILALWVLTTTEHPPL